MCEYADRCRNREGLRSGILLLRPGTGRLFQPRTNVGEGRLGSEQFWLADWPGTSATDRVKSRSSFAASVFKETTCGSLKSMDGPILDDGSLK